MTFSMQKFCFIALVCGRLRRDQTCCKALASVLFIMTNKALLYNEIKAE